MTCKLVHKTPASYKHKQMTCIVILVDHLALREFYVTSNFGISDNLQ